MPRKLLSRAPRANASVRIQSSFRALPEVQSASTLAKELGKEELTHLVRAETKEEGCKRFKREETSSREGKKRKPRAICQSNVFEKETRTSTTQKNDDEEREKKNGSSLVPSRQPSHVTRLHASPREPAFDNFRDDGEIELREKKRERERKRKRARKKKKKKKKKRSIDDEPRAVALSLSLLLWPTSTPSACFLLSLPKKTQDNAPTTNTTTTTTTTTTPTTVVDLRVDMACSGCEAAVRRVLEATPRVASVSVDLASQRVSVGVERGALSPEQVLAAAAKSGKKAELWS